eukprot:941351-Pyramimonas_sp.AAC.1
MIWRRTTLSLSHRRGPAPWCVSDILSARTNRRSEGGIYSAREPIAGVKAEYTQRPTTTISNATDDNDADQASVQSGAGVVRVRPIGRRCRAGPSNRAPVSRRSVQSGASVVRVRPIGRRCRGGPSNRAPVSC